MSTQTFNIAKGQLSFGITLWWLLVVVLVVNSWNPYELQNILGFLFLFTVPGTLTLTLLKLTHIEIWGRTALMVGLSTLLLIILGLLSNTILPFVGVERPLDLMPVLSEVSILVFILLYFAQKHMQPLIVTVPRYGLADSKRDLVLMLIPLLFLVLSILGAIRLNNGEGSVLTIVMLSCMAIYATVLVRYSNDVGRNVIPFAIFFISLALLFMTSLRGWHITGHDIQREFFVFQLAKDAGIWSMAAYTDAYNACLSITILPTMLAQLLSVADEYIYKVFIQIVFALTPVVAYLIGRNWTSTRLSLLAGFYFMAFPTFFQDMPFLVRQEIAFLFFGLMVYVLFQQQISLSMRRLLFVAMGIGIVLSHYSTTYTILFVLGLSVLAMPIFVRLVARVSDMPLFSRSSIKNVYHQGVATQKTITVGMVLTLLVVSIFWTSIVTQTSDHFSEVAGTLLEVVRDGFADGSRSVDALSFFTFGTPDSVEHMSDYIQEVVEPMRLDSSSEYYAQESYSAYVLNELGEERRPLTPIGTMFGDSGALASVVSFVGKILVKVLEFAVPIGLLYVLFRRRLVGFVEGEYFVLAASSIVFIALTIVLPVLSVEYGVFRALQQSMFVVAPFMVLGTTLIGAAVLWVVLGMKKYIGKKGAWEKPSFEYSMTSTTALMIIFFLYSTGLLSQFVGNNLATLHLNNDGSDYDHYLTQVTEHRAIQWLGEIANEHTRTTGEEFPLIQADRFGQKKAQSQLQLRIAGSIYPGIVTKDAYVFLTTANTKDGKATVTHNNTLITYMYDTLFLDTNKNRVYDNGSTRIYK